MPNEILARSSAIVARAIASISFLRSGVSPLLSGASPVSRSCAKAFSPRSKYRPISGVFFIGLIRQILGLETPARKGGFQEYPVRRVDIGDGVDVAVRKKHEHALAGIFRPVRVFDIFLEAAAFARRDVILQAYPSLWFRFEFAILFDAPNDR